MSKYYEKHYEITSNGKDEIRYEDPSCYITVSVADFRDKVWWIGARTIFNKKNGSLEKISKKQKYEVFRRVSADAKLHGVPSVYTDEFEYIEEDVENIDYTKDILDIEE
jgi:hypothetical protein